jgi:antitoxin (DNA-binding transcriptional repressor) of toxin-antitoxin stability system
MAVAVRITRDTVADMGDVSIRELRNQGGEIVNRAVGGEPITITRSGRPVAELRALRPPLTAGALLGRWHTLPPVDPATLRADIDQLLDSRL